MYYVTWIGKCIIFARIKSLRQKKVIDAFFYSILRDFQLKDFRLNSLKWCRFPSFELQKCALHHIGVEFEEELHGMT